MEKVVVVIFILGIWFKCYVCQDSVAIKPSPTASADEGKSLTLTCTYTGSGSPSTVIWYINNHATGMSVLISTCAVVGSTASVYEVSRYSFICSNPYSLTFTEATSDDNGDVWGCTVGISGVSSPSISQTTISIKKKDSAGLSPGAIAGIVIGVVVFLIHVILILLIIRHCQHGLSSGVLIGLIIASVLFVAIEVLLIYLIFKYCCKQKHGSSEQGEKAKSTKKNQQNVALQGGNK